MKDKNELSTNTHTNPYIKEAGDKITQEKMPCGDVMTRYDTKELNATERQYMKKDGTPGKKTLILKQIDNN